VLHGVLPYGSMYRSDELDIRFWTRGKFNCIVTGLFISGSLNLLYRICSDRKLFSRHIALF